MNFRNTFAEIDLNAIGNNINAVRRAAPGRKILFAVKADAYGHGVSEIAKYAERNSLVDYFGVSSIEEGIELRENGITLPVMILGLTLPLENNIINIIKADLIPSAADISFITLLDEISKKMNRITKIHVKTDTGMGRIGCKPEDAPEIIRHAMNCRNIELEGLFSHMPVSDDANNGFNFQQISVFKKLIENLESENIKIPLKHLANSAAIINFPDSHFDMVRPGIICYGYRPDYKTDKDIGIIPSLSLQSQVVFTKRISKGSKLSYGHIYETPDDCYISTIPVGYGDGYSRFFSNCGKVIINNEIYPVVGRVCMDQLLINTGSDRIEPGTRVFLFDRKTFTVDDAAAMINTISYEITCSISRRVPRIYIR